MRSNRLAAMTELIAASFRLPEYECVSTTPAPLQYFLKTEQATINQFFLLAPNLANMRRQPYEVLILSVTFSAATI